MASCDLCGLGPITWTRTEAGKGMPINSRPDPNGTAWFVQTPEGRRLRVASKKNPKPDDGGATKFYRPHFLTCEVYAAKKRLEAMFR